MERDSAMASFAFRGSREPVTLLEDSFFHVRQLVPSLVPAVIDALHADPYVSPSTGGIDRDTEYAYCATTQKCHVCISCSEQLIRRELAATLCSSPSPIKRKC